MGVPWLVWFGSRQPGAGWRAMTNERVDSSSLLELIDEQEDRIEQHARDLAVARRSLDRARTQWLVLQNYDTAASTQEREEAAMHLEGLAAYVQQLEDGIIAGRVLIKAYRKARFENMPVVRALGFVRRQVTRRLPATGPIEPYVLEGPKERRALEE